MIARADQGPGEHRPTVTLPRLLDLCAAVGVIRGSPNPLRVAAVGEVERVVFAPNQPEGSIAFRFPENGRGYHVRPGRGLVILDVPYEAAEAMHAQLIEAGHVKMPATVNVEVEQLDAEGGA